MRNPRTSRWIAATLCSVALIGVGGCRSDQVVPGVPASITIVAGANQQAPVGTGLPVPPSAEVRDGNGNAVAGVTVRFSVVAGAGVLLGDSAITDVSGRATVGEWILGTIPGTNTLQAQVISPALAASVSATAVAGNGVSVRSSGQSGFLALVGQAVTPSPAVLVLDSFGNPVSGASVTFTIAQGGGTVVGGSTTTNASGVAQVGAWTLGGTPGTNLLVARIAGGATITFTAQGVVAAPVLAAASPTSQSGFLSFHVPEIPRVLVTDQLGHVLAGVPVAFAVTSGDATVTDGIGISDANGIAAPGDWRLGLSSATVTATAGLGAPPVVFTASGVPARFLIDVRFLTAMTPDVRDAFVAAATRWMGIITAHLPAVNVNLPAGACSTLQPAINEQLTDLVIFAEVSPIDGPGQILGSSGPCATRSTTDLTVIGTMQFDSADLQSLVDTHQIVATITHEMAHVLGFGTIWADRGVISGAGGADPIFTGAGALALWPPFGTALGYAGRPIPVENQFGAGTRDSHWRESVFHDELMTGFIAAPGVFMPLSKLTIASLGDLGYQVDLTKADLFVGNLMAGARITTPSMQLNERLPRPSWKISPIGTVRVPQ